MKYKAKKITIGEHTGKWAVFAGSRYWEHTCTDDQNESEKAALRMSACWYRDQMDIALMKYDELAQADGTYCSSDPHSFLA